MQKSKALSTLIKQQKRIVSHSLRHLGHEVTPAIRYANKSSKQTKKIIHWQPQNHDPLCKQMQTKERKSYAVASSQAFASKGLPEFFFFNPASFLLHDPRSDTRTPHLVHERF